MPKLCLVTPGRSPMNDDSLCRTGTPLTDFICAIVPHYVNFYKATIGLDGFHVHDSSALAYVIDPSLFETKFVYVDVEYVSPHHFGHTVPDWRGQRDEEPNVHVCVDVDSERFLDLYHQRLTEADL